MRVNDTRSSVRSSTLVPDLSGPAVERIRDYRLTDEDLALVAYALDAFRDAAARGPAGCRPQHVIADYLREDHRLRAGLRVMLEGQGEDEPPALLVAFLWLLCEGQALSDLGRRFLTAAILQLDRAALIADVMAGGDDEAA